MRRMKKAAVWLGVFAILAAMTMLGSACSSGEAKADQGTSSLKTNDASKIITEDKWKKDFPDEVETLKMGEKDNKTIDYLEEYPFLKTIYEGSPFSKSYESARAHNFALEDVKKSPRISEKSKATCFSCKTAQYTLAEEEMGDKLYTMGFAEASDKMTIGITCYDCHKNNPGSGEGEVGSIRSHFNSAFGDLVERGRVSESTAACAQCHNEYYFDPTSKAVALPTHLTDPTEILAFYDSIGFKDFDNPRTGTAQLKVQHPEFQMLAGSPHAINGLDCSSCHMEKKDGKNGAFLSHEMTSPLENDAIFESVCLDCHQGETHDSLMKMTKDIQVSVEDKTHTCGDKLADLTNKLADAKASGKYSEAELDAVRKLNRSSQFYLDWVLVENSTGFHNPTQANDCLDKSLAMCEQALSLLNK